VPDPRRAKSVVQPLHEIVFVALCGAVAGTLRNSFDAATGKQALHVVSAWAAEQRLTLGQVATDANTNEIDALPRLLDLLDRNGAVATVDALGCQTAAKVVDTALLRRVAVSLLHRAEDTWADKLSLRIRRLDRPRAGRSSKSRASPGVSVA
jgi:hypothetical protein